MTFRTNAVGNVTVYAGTGDELAAIAADYARGARRLPRGCHPELFQRAAQLLLTGDYPALDLGDVRFYRDRPGGEPYRGPYAPDADPAWVARQQTMRVRA